MTPHDVRRTVVSVIYSENVQMLSRHFTRLGWPLAALVTLSACSEMPTPPSAARSVHVSAARVISGVPLPRAVVVFHDTTAIPAAGLALVASLGGSVSGSFDDIGVAFVDGLSATALAQLAASDLVAGVGYDRLVNWLPGVRGVAAIQASDPLVPSANPWDASFYKDGRQWGPRIMEADVAWRAGLLGTRSTRVGILDTGIDYDNRELAGLVDRAASRSFSSLIAEAAGTVVDVPIEPQVPGDEPYMDNHFHGTHVASTVAANARSVAGITQFSTLVAVKVLNFLGSGSFESVAAGIRYAAIDADVDVINMSLGAEVDVNEEGVAALLEMMRRAIRDAEKHGTIVISAAGNSGLDLDAGSVVATPCEQSTICVSATGPLLQQNFDQPATYTNFGRTAIQVAAPGGNSDPDGNSQTEDLIIGACSRRNTQPGLTPCRGSTDGVAYFYAWAAGTSMATPHTAGLAALVKSANPLLSVNGLRNRILNTADDVGVKGRDVYSNYGRINARRAMGL
jgi:lantibiotic leader peptide-processing serine protease